MWTLYQTIWISNEPNKSDFVNILWKGENAGKQHFLLFWQFATF